MDAAVSDRARRFMVGVKRRLQAAVPPCVFLLLVAYFLWSATQGDRGLRAMAQREEDLRGAQAMLARAEAETAVWERRVASLRSAHIDRDALDERARAMLNLSHPDDVIVLYPNNQKLF